MKIGHRKWFPRLTFRVMIFLQSDTLETSAVNLCKGQSMLSTQLKKPNYFVISQQTQNHSFFRNIFLLFKGLQLSDIPVEIFIV